MFSVWFHLFAPLLYILVLVIALIIIQSFRPTAFVAFYQMSAFKNICKWTTVYCKLRCLLLPVQVHSFWKNFTEENFTTPLPQWSGVTWCIAQSSVKVTGFYDYGGKSQLKLGPVNICFRSVKNVTSQKLIRWKFCHSFVDPVKDLQMVVDPVINLVLTGSLTQGCFTCTQNCMKNHLSKEKFVLCWKDIVK